MIATECETPVKLTRLTVGIATALVGALAAFGALYWIPASKGYCFEEQRFVPDRELILRAMGHASNRIDIGLSSNDFMGFLDRYPECCSISRRPHLIPFAGETDWGLYDVYVVMQGPYRARPGESQPTPFYRVDTLLTSCGRLARYDWTDPPLALLNWYPRH